MASGKGNRMGQGPGDEGQKTLTGELAHGRAEQNHNEKLLENNKAPEEP